MIKVLHFVSKMDRAGQETFIMNVYRNINKKKFQFVFLCTDHAKGDFDDEIKGLGGSLFYLPINPNTSGVKRYIQDYSNLVDWLEKNRCEYDIVHLHTYHALDVFVHLMACRRVKCNRLVVHSHNTFGAHQRLHNVFRFINNLYPFKRFACAYDAGVWLYGNRRMKKDDVQIVYNGINLEDYRYSENERIKCRRELEIEESIVIGHIGRFSESKNHTQMIEIFQSFHERIPDTILLLIGKGELQNDIKRKVDMLGLSSSVKFLGTRDDIPRLLAAMDILLFPSLHEGLSVVLVEAQASGLKCVVSDNILPQEENIIPELFTKVSISEPYNIWADSLKRTVEQNIDRNECCNVMLKSNFNITYTVKQMEVEYEKIAAL